MPRKRSTPQYSFLKPQSTPHPSLGSAATSTSLSSSSSSQNATPLTQSVNELITSSRSNRVSVSTRSLLPPTPAAQTLPPQIRHLLSLPETAASPRPRNRTGYAPGRANNRVAGPAPPRSWLEGSRFALISSRNRHCQRLYPAGLDHLPGLPVENESTSKSLQSMCLRTMALHWGFIQEYEKNNLADLPTPLRVRLLSNIAVDGPDEGVGFEGLKNLLLIPADALDEASDSGEKNEDFHRLDLSGSVGRSISLKQLIQLMEKPAQLTEEVLTELSWEESIALPLNATIPHLTHLSVSHPPQSISWPRLLMLAKHIPTVTHLSLAYWPVPSLTPNARNTVVSSKYAKDIQYGGTNYYSHTLDNDFREAADVLRKLASRVPSLEYLDLTGCTDWLRALGWNGEDEGDRGLEWGSQWVRLNTLRIYSGVFIDNDSKFSDVVRFIQAANEALATEDMLSWWTSKRADAKKRKQWVCVEKDDLAAYDGLWTGDEPEEKRKRSALDSLKRKYGAGQTTGEVRWIAPIVHGDVEDALAAAGVAVWD